MRRRNVIRGGMIMTLGSVAGCIGEITGDGDDGSDATTTTESDGESDGESTPESPEEPDEGGVSYSVEPATSEVNWGDLYEVSVTVRAGEDPPMIGTVIIYEKKGDRGSFGATQKMWSLGSGESATETFEIEPSTVGDLTLRLLEVTEEEVVDEWELTVNPPVQSFGETLSYYNGLEMTVDAELHEWLDLTLSWDGGDETGTYAVRPRDGQWVKVPVRGKNNSAENKTLTAPAGGDFSALADETSLNQIGSGGESVGADTDYEIDDPTREEKGAEMEIKDAYWHPPGQGFTRGELDPNAAHEGMLLFATDMDTTKENLRIQLKWSGILATWRQ